MYNRNDADGGFPQDPLVCIKDVFGDIERQMVYAKDSNDYDTKILIAEEGMEVFIRKRRDTGNGTSAGSGASVMKK